MTSRLAFAIETAMKAGKSTLPHFRNRIPVQIKADGSPVTQADVDAETILRNEIEMAYPGEPVLGEEMGGGQFGTGWILDPIDGTKSFICGVPLYSTLISYEENSVPVVAVAYFPAIDEIVYAEKGGGCFFNGSPTRVSTKMNLAESTLCCSSPTSLLNNNKLSGLMNLSEKTRAVRTWCDAYGHCLVATGRVEAMIDAQVSRWDISSVQLLVAEAGGRSSDFSNQLFPNSELLSSNGILHSDLIEAFAS